MAVVYVEELFPGRQGGDDIDRKRDYTRVFEVRTDDPEDDAYTAGAGTGSDIPRNGEPHPSDPDAIMVRIRAHQSEDDNTLWRVECEYSSDIPPEQGREALAYDFSGDPIENPNSSTGGSGGGGSGSQIVRDPDPRNRPAQISTRWEQTTEVVRKDINGVLITNSANWPYDPPPTVERSYPVITVTKNVAMDSPVLSIGYQKQYMEGVNDDEPWGQEQGIFRVVGLETHSEVENGVAYGVATLSLKVKWDGWLLSLVDAGFRDLDGERIGLDPVTGAYPTEPVPLDGAGFELAAGETPEPIDWEVYRPMPFIPLLAEMGVAA